MISRSLLGRFAAVLLMALGAATIPPDRAAAATQQSMCVICLDACPGNPHAECQDKNCGQSEGCMPITCHAGEDNYPWVVVCEGIET